MRSWRLSSALNWGGCGHRRGCHQREDHPLDRGRVAAPTAQQPADALIDAQPTPQPSSTHVPPSCRELTNASSPSVSSPPSPAAAGGRRKLQLGRRPEIATDRGHQPGQGVPVQLVLPPEAVDHLRHRVARDRVPLVVRQRCARCWTGWTDRSRGRSCSRVTEAGHECVELIGALPGTEHGHVAPLGATGQNTTVRPSASACCPV